MQNSPLSENTFIQVIKVQPPDIDTLDHVNNVVYLRWVQDVATAHWEKIASTEMKKKYLWVVLRHEIDYRNPAVLGDELTVRTWVGSSEGAKSVRHVEFLLSASGKLVAEAKTTWCLLDSQTMRPKRIESDIASIFQ
jgi:acyl-CoA thioester hydrolase